MTKMEIEIMIQDSKRKLNETLDTANQTRGAVEESLRILIPAMQEQLLIMKAILERTLVTPNVSRAEGGE